MPAFPMYRSDILYRKLAMLKLFNIFIVVGLAVIVGCSAARQGFRSDNLAREDIRILLINDGYDDIRVYDELGRIATIFPGRSECVRLRNPEQTTQLSFDFIASRRRYYTPTQNFSGSSGWEWTINSRMAANSTIRMNVAEPCGNNNSVEYYHR